MRTPGFFYSPMHFNFATNDERACARELQCQRFSGHLRKSSISIDYPSPNPPLIAGTQNVNAFRDTQGPGWHELVVRYPAGSRAQYHPDNQLPSATTCTTCSLVLTLQH